MTEDLLIDTWVLRLARFERLHIALSGGMDSVVLLHSLATQSKLHPKLTAVYVHHGLSINANDWEQHCQRLCKQFNISLKIITVTLSSQSNLEEEARKLRYRALSDCLEINHALLTGHHQDDQAETLLLQLARGSGITGLCGMQDCKALGKGTLLRPLLNYSRAQLEDYARKNNLSWVEDESNTNLQFSRNFIRHQVIPLLQKRWPAITRNLARTSNHCQQAQSNLQDLARIDCPTLNAINNYLPLTGLELLADARLINVLRVWLQNNQVQSPNSLILNNIIQEVIRANEWTCPEICWSNYRIKRYQQRLYLLTNFDIAMPANTVWEHFPEPLFVNGWGILSISSMENLCILPGQCIEVRARKGGETFQWHGQTKSLKKLMQEWKIPPWLRAKIPLIYVDGKLAAIVNYAIADEFLS